MNSKFPTTHGQGFFYRPVGQNRRPPVAVNRTGLTGYRKKTGQIQNPNQKLMFNRFLSASRPVYQSGLTGYRSVGGNRPNSFFFFFGLNSNARKVY